MVSQIFNQNSSVQFSVILKLFFIHFKKQVKLKLLKVKLKNKIKLRGNGHFSKSNKKWIIKSNMDIFPKILFPKWVWAERLVYFVLY